MKRTSVEGLTCPLSHRFMMEQIEEALLQGLGQYKTCQNPLTGELYIYIDSFLATIRG